VVVLAGTALDIGIDLRRELRGVGIGVELETSRRAGVSSCGESTPVKRPSSECLLPHEYGEGSMSFDRSVLIGAGRRAFSSSLG
jgi:hypothetical protein